MPDHSEAIRRVRKEIIESRKGFQLQMDKLTDTILQGNYDVRVMSVIQKRTPKALAQQKNISFNSRVRRA